MNECQINFELSISVYSQGGCKWTYISFIYNNFISKLYNIYYVFHQLLGANVPRGEGS